MQLIDRYAYSAKKRTVDPAHKALVAAVVLTLCLVLDKPLVGLAAAAGMCGLACLWASMPPAVFARVLAAEAGFVLLAVLGIALSIGTGAQPPRLFSVAVGPVWIGTDSMSMSSAGRIAGRALGCVAAMNFLALTTPLVDLLEVARRLRLPPLLCDLVTVVYRFTFTLLETLGRMHRAQESRLGYVSLRRGVASAGLLGGQLLLDAYRRSRRLETALQSRGYHGELKVLPITYRADRQLCYAGAGIVAGLFLVWGLT